MITEHIAETIWRAEFRRATGKERNIPWSEVADVDRQRYLYVANAVCDEIFSPKKV